uniref:Uncharacterized protein n=1 Tax=Peronospora matthiolae TaxID=2874970 RepID=A0AAV1VHK4_9STRA
MGKRDHSDPQLASLSFPACGMVDSRTALRRKLSCDWGPVEDGWIGENDEEKVEEKAAGPASLRTLWPSLQRLIKLLRKLLHARDTSMAIDAALEFQP